MKDNYKHHINSAKKEIVIDIGMNIGDSPLYFLQNEKVEKVYAYEPFKKTFMDAKNNLKQNINSDRLEIFNYGLSDHNGTECIETNAQMSAGQSTIQEVNDMAVERYASWQFIDKSDNQKEEIVLRKSSEVIDEIIKGHPDFELC